MVCVFYNQVKSQPGKHCHLAKKGNFTPCDGCPDIITIGEKATDARPPAVGSPASKIMLIQPQLFRG